MLWKKPLVIQTREGTFTIRGPAEALDYMASHWPEKPGYMVGLARRRCSEALDNPARLRVAKLAFRAAVVEIGMFPDRPRRPRAGAQI